MTDGKHTFKAYIGDDLKGTFIGKRTADTKSDPFLTPVTPVPTTFPFKIKVEVKKQMGHTFLSPIELIIGKIF